MELWELLMIKTSLRIKKQKAWASRLDDLVEQVAVGEKDPYTASDDMLEQIFQTK